METLDLPIKLGLALILGAVIGFEREINEKREEDELSKHPHSAVLGIRSFSLLAGLGGITGALALNFMPLALLIGAAFFSLLILYYYSDIKASGDYGFTTEISVIYTFLIGLLLMLEILPTTIIVAFTVVVTLLLSRKKQIKSFVSDVNHNQINAFISFGIIALVILPFLPNTTYALSDIPFIKQILTNFQVPAEKLAELKVFNPFKIWLLVALITGLDIVGYLLERLVGQKKGWILTSIAGGFISSTATTQSLAQQSKESKTVSHLLAAALLSNLTSFFQIGILILVANPEFFARLLPTLVIMIVVTTLITLFFLMQKDNSKTTVKLKSHDIFNLAPALKFALIFFVITVVSKVALELFGESAFLITTALGAFAGLDAVMLNTAELARQTITVQLAVQAFIVANGVNLLAKTVYSYLQGSKEFTFKFFIGVVLIIGGSLIGLLFV